MSGADNADPSAEAEQLRAQVAALEKQLAGFGDLEQRCEEQTRELRTANRILREDVARLDELTKQLQQHERELMSERRLLKRLLDLHERDRQLVAYEIHDGIVQDMTAASMFLQAAASAIPADKEAAKSSFEKALRLVRESIDEARRQINGLRPPVLEDEGLVKAIDSLAEETAAKYDLPVTFQHDVRFERIAPALELSVYRVVQEALNNARRHSQTPRVEITLVQEDDSLAISVVDFGVGFDISGVPRGRCGLTGIQERARILGGSADITSEPGKGTRIHVRLPLTDALLPDEL